MLMLLVHALACTTPDLAQDGHVSVTEDATPASPEAPEPQGTDPAVQPATTLAPGPEVRTSVEAVRPSVDASAAPVAEPQVVAAAEPPTKGWSPGSLVRVAVVGAVPLLAVGGLGAITLLGVGFLLGGPGQLVALALIALAVGAAALLAAPLSATLETLTGITGPALGVRMLLGPAAALGVLLPGLAVAAGAGMGIYALTAWAVQRGAPAWPAVLTGGAVTGITGALLLASAVGIGAALHVALYVVPAALAQ